MDVDLVNVLCSVHNKSNGLVGNLEKKNFQIFEDGKEQEIKYFTRETDLPLTIGLLVDTSKSQERLMDIETPRRYRIFLESSAEERSGVSDAVRRGSGAACRTTPTRQGCCRRA